MSADVSVGRSYREPRWLERLARLVPARAVPGRLRERLKPAFGRLLSARGVPMKAVLPGGETFVVAPTHRHVTWNAEEYAAFRGAVPEGAAVLDIGANVGAYSILFARWAGPRGRVFAFEPDPAAFEGLVAHVALNHMAGCVEPLAQAVGEAPRPHIRFALGEFPGTSRMTGADVAADNVIDVPMTSIDSFCGSRGIRPSLIKIDAEGAELQILRGARETIAASGPDLAIFVEFHPAILRASRVSMAELERQCHALGLEFAAIDGADGEVAVREGVCVRLRPRSRRDGAQQR